MGQAREVVVTGGASGIGKATADLFRSYGDRVTVLDRTAAPDSTATVLVDLADSDSIARAVEELPEQIDVLCNVAGVSGLAGPRMVLAVNFFAVRELTGLVLPRLVDGGAVVTVASTSGWRWRDHLDDVLRVVDAPDVEAAIDLLGADLDGYLAYNRAKEAVVVWTSLASHAQRGRVRINSVSPGPVATPLLDDFYVSMGAAELDPLVEAAGRQGTPQEIAEVVAFLASSHASWVNGTDVVTDFGAEMALTLEAAQQAGRSASESA